jgi:hypothetical protein
LKILHYGHNQQAWPNENSLPPFVPEKRAQQFCAFSSQQAACHFQLMIKLTVPAYPVPRDHSAGLRIRSTEYQAFYAGVDNGTGTHDTRLNGNIQGCVEQPVILKPLPCCPQCHHFGMSGRVTVNNGPVACGRKHCSGFINYDSTYRHLAALLGFMCFLQGKVHEMKVDFCKFFWGIRHIITFNMNLKRKKLLLSFSVIIG